LAKAIRGSSKLFPISRDPPEGGTGYRGSLKPSSPRRFQFLGIPPKGEQQINGLVVVAYAGFQFLGIPPKGELPRWFRDVPGPFRAFPISRDPPEGGTPRHSHPYKYDSAKCFQFLGIPPKGELQQTNSTNGAVLIEFPISRDPPEGGTRGGSDGTEPVCVFPISRDPPEGGTCQIGSL